MNPLLSYHVYHNDDAPVASFADCKRVIKPTPGSLEAERHRQDADLERILDSIAESYNRTITATAHGDVQAGIVKWLDLDPSTDFITQTEERWLLSLGDFMTDLQMKVAQALNIPYDMVIAEPGGRVTFPGGMVPDTQANRDKLAHLQYGATLEDAAPRYDGTLSCMGDVIKAWLGMSYPTHQYLIMENRSYEIDVTVAMGFRPSVIQCHFAQMNLNDYIDRYRAPGVRVNLILSPAETLK